MTAKAGSEGFSVHWLGDEEDVRSLRVIRVQTAGLSVDILPDRCLDLGAAEHRGVSMAWMSGEPLRHPASLVSDGWATRFVGGLLATCGLDNVGPACLEGGRSFPQHGRIGAVPADNVRYGTRRTNGSRTFWISGEVAQPHSGLRLRRRILVPGGSVRLRLHDVVRNTGKEPEPVMLQYHCNFGEPFVAQGARIAIPRTTVTPRDPAADAALELWGTVDEPRAGEEERVYRHDQRGQDKPCAYIIPPADGPAARHALRLCYRRRTLPWLWQWRLLSEDAYVVGLEPSNCRSKPREEACRLGDITVLPPGGEIGFDMEIAVCPRDQAPEEQGG